MMPEAYAINRLIMAPLFRFKYALHGQHKLFPMLSFGFQSLSSGPRDGVHTRLAIILRRLQFGADFAAQFQPMQGGIQRALTGIQPFARHLSNAVRDAPSVIRSK